ncbi:LuxR family transcriptional regulator [Burkholderia sp. MSMB1078WGS]|uniref:response regulator n=1 Tax=unclassified Burkholderia TaxID=2613784 RepID=UPI00075353C7|nr:MULTISPECIES: response regulator [unclassified Burkholderia]KVD46930.1 LuxR family transcriptional regulator [Burkholderia sp. ABCPW 11]KVT17631.1 LuxR family transcriptional regulator [Burkholderia sp. MSMB1078WGS]
MKTNMIHVAVTDDHPAILFGVKHELSNSQSISVDGLARNSTELFDLLSRMRFDVLVCDYSMPAGNYGDGVALLSLIQQRYPHLKIVVLTMLESPAILSALTQLDIPCIVSKSDLTTHLSRAVHAAYANGGYMSPTIERILRAQRLSGRATRGEPRLTLRELEVVRLFVSGMRIDEIAERLHRSKKTISTQKSNAMLKLNIEREVDLVRYGIETGLVPSTARPIEVPTGITDPAEKSDQN